MTIIAIENCYQHHKIIIFLHLYGIRTIPKQ